MTDFVDQRSVYEQLSTSRKRSDRLGVIASSRCELLSVRTQTQDTQDEKIADESQQMVGEQFDEIRRNSLRCIERRYLGVKTAVYLLSTCTQLFPFCEAFELSL